jgi:DNA-binding MarR family transcriptional regulator
MTAPTTGFLVWRLSMRWRAAADRVLEPLGLTQALFSLLGALSGLPESPTQRELADFTGLEALYVSKLARGLERAGLVERTPDARDPRAVRLALTERGREVVTEAIATVHAKHAELTSAIGGPNGARNHDLRETLLTLLGEIQGAEGETTMTAPQVISGQDINVAAAATRSVLDGLLHQAGLSFTQFVALRALPGERDALVRNASGPAAGEEALSGALDELVENGFVFVDKSGSFDRTERGEELFERIAAASARASAEIYGGIASDDLVAAKRVLDIVTTRAKGVHVEF